MCARTRGGKLLTAAAVIAILAAAGSVLFIMTGYKADAYALEMLASYSPVPLDPDMTEIIVVGSDDQVINWDKFQEGRQYDTSFCTVEIIEGGNHAGFGCYGEQRGDGPASITQQEQIDQTVNIVLNAI